MSNQQYMFIVGILLKHFINVCQTVKCINQGELYDFLFSRISVCFG